jgi:hypothetical protein
MVFCIYFIILWNVSLEPIIIYLIQLSITQVYSIASKLNRTVESAVDRVSTVRMSIRIAESTPEEHFKKSATKFQIKF